METKWQSFNAAVAWVRKSGTDHTENGFKSFVERGGSVKISVGLDSNNTSVEGLKSLLSIQKYGYSRIYIYHNEANVIFHPKIYMFNNDNEARLIVGSNNLTSSGLYRNTEAGLQINAIIEHKVVTQALQSFSVWQDTSTPFVRLLDDGLLADMIKKKYVFSEAHLAKHSESGKSYRKKEDRLFGFHGVSAPAIPKVGEIELPKGAVSSVLLMRLRRASERERRTQVQIPIRVVSTGFFGKDESVISAHDGRVHTLRYASARGGTNTIKLELPEIDPMVDPVSRFERHESGIEYQVYDAESTLGKPIMEALKRGREMHPPATMLTLESKPDISTWWRFA
jgi:HKD family nuclease/hemin uptake protein HemP